MYRRAEWTKNEISKLGRESQGTAIEKHLENVLNMNVIGMKKMKNIGTNW